MKTLGLIGIGLAECATAAYVSYLTLPEHERQYVRMRAFYLGGSVARAVASHAGQLAIRLEHAYWREVSPHG